MCIKSSLVFFSWVRIHLYSPKSLLRSKVENTLVLAKKSGASASKGIGKLPTLVTLLTLRKSIQNLCDPSFLFTIATGELQGETDSSYSFFTNFVHPTVDLWEITVHILNSSPQFVWYPPGSVAFLMKKRQRKYSGLTHILYYLINVIDRSMETSKSFRVIKMEPRYITTISNLVDK